jgi:putative membrane protein
MTPEVSAFVAGFPIALLHAGVAILLVALGAAIHAVLSPGKEISQIRDGNSASAVAFAGVIFGLALSQARSLAAAPSLIEIALWGGAVVAVQLFLFWLVELLLAGLAQRVRDEADISAAVLLSGAKLATAVILAAAVSG